MTRSELDMRYTQTRRLRAGLYVVQDMMSDRKAYVERFSGAWYAWLDGEDDGALPYPNKREAVDAAIWLITDDVAKIQPNH